MNSYSYIQFITLIIYFILIIILVRYAQTRLKSLIVLYLTASIAWSLSSFMAHADFSSDQAVLWAKAIPFAALWTVIAYAHFIVVFLGKPSTIITGLGYGCLTVVAALITLGYIPQSVYNAGNGIVAIDYGYWMYLLTAFGAFFMGLAIFYIFKSFSSSRSPEHRNRVLYLLAGIGLIVAFGIWFETLSPPRYPIDHIGHLSNALVLSYAIVRHRLLDIRLVIRRGLVYSGITICITATYLIALGIFNLSLHKLGDSVNLGVMVILAVAMALMFNPLRVMIQKYVDKLFYGKQYDYRETVLNLTCNLSNVIDIHELADTLLRPLTKAVSASQAVLLLPDEKGFSSQFAATLATDEPAISISLRKDNPVVTWLMREEKLLSREVIDISAEFKGLWESEQRAIDTAAIDLFLPMISKRKLIGIIALGKKRPRGGYSSDDSNLLMTVSSGVAIALENAQLYTQAKQRANTDELTGLFNHRYFHQRLDEEIARGSRFGEIFSLIFLDIDLFKSFNDIHGHLQGDEILNQIGQCIKTSTRGIDIACRYGGDEFAIIMPQASLENTCTVALRLRKIIEDTMDSRGTTVTCSFGIALWPTDGVMREEIIQAVDAAMYYAKQTGRNRLCAAHEVALSDVLKMKKSSHSDEAILSTIYALAATVDAKDHHTYGHSKKVSKYAMELAEALGYTQEAIERIRAAAMLHDIGKIGISDQVLQKPGVLSPEEWEPMRSHPNLGVSILKHIEGLNQCLAAVQYHHERYDGTGYPSGLRGENIPLDARIMALADAYDAMTSTRPYKRHPISHKQAIEEIKRCSGTQFDPKIVEVFLQLYEVEKVAAKSHVIVVR